MFSFQGKILYLHVSLPFPFPQRFNQSLTRNTQPTWVVQTELEIPHTLLQSVFKADAASFESAALSWGRCSCLLFFCFWGGQQRNKLAAYFVRVQSSIQQADLLRLEASSGMQTSSVQEFGGVSSVRPEGGRRQEALCYFGHLSHCKWHVASSFPYALTPALPLSPTPICYSWLVIVTACDVVVVVVWHLPVNNV